MPSAQPSSSAVRFLLPSVRDIIFIFLFWSVLAGPLANRPLAVRKIHVTQPTMTVTFLVDERPTKAGVDPFNKLIDRAPEDNVMACSIAH